MGGDFKERTVKMFKKEEKKYMCSRCDYGMVCKFRSEYEAAQKRIEDMVDDAFSVPEFVSPVILQCKYFHRAIPAPR
jgi:hypothetical protein